MERYRDVKAVLRLLTNVTQRDLVDFGSLEGQPGVDVAQVRTIHFYEFRHQQLRA